MDTSRVVAGKVDWSGRPANRDKHGGCFNSLFIIALYGLDSFAIMALAVTTQTYFTDIMHLGAQEAMNVLTHFLGTSYILTTVAAYISDAFIARYKVILVSAFIEILGLILLTVQAKTQSLKPTPCNPYDPTSRILCEKVRGRASAFLYSSLYLIAVGTAGIKSCIPAHGADQFDEEDPKEAKQLSSYFNWLFLSSSIGATASLVLTVWIQTDVGWGWGFGVSTIGMFIGVVIFVVGLPRYRVHDIPKTNPITCILKVYIAAFQNRKLQLPQSSRELYEIDCQGESVREVEFIAHTKCYRFLDKAAIKNDHNSTPKPCRVTQVECAKIILSITPIFFATIILNIFLTQFLSYSINQGVTMNTYIRSFKVPATPFTAYLFMLLLIPLYDRLFVPFARKFTNKSTGITHFQRVALGIAFSILAMVSGAILESKRKHVAEKHNMVDAIPLKQLLPISFFWLSFQYFFYGISQVLIVVGLLEFYYREAPRELKASSTCFLWFSIGFGYFMRTVVVGWVNDTTRSRTATRGWLVGVNINRNHLNLFYWTLAVLSLINLINFLFWAKGYKYKAQNSRVRDDENGVRTTNGV